LAINGAKTTKFVSGETLIISTFIDVLTKDTLSPSFLYINYACRIMFCAASAYHFPLLDEESRTG
jgi:hypothetical protein